MLGLPEAIATGALAGYNAVRYTLGIPMLILPRSTAIGDIIAYANYKMATTEGIRGRYTFAGSDYFKRMKENNLYTTDIEVIKDRIKRLNLENIFKEKLA